MYEKKNEIFCSSIWEIVSKSHCEKCKKENDIRNCAYENTLEEIGITKEERN